MRNIIYILTFLTLISCNNGEKPTINKPGIETTTLDRTTVGQKEKKQIQFSNQQLDSFLDSIGKLTPTQWVDSLSYRADCNFKNAIQINQLISEKDFETLKISCKTKVIDSKTAKRIFKNLDDSIYDGNKYIKVDSIPLSYFSFDTKENDFNEFAVFPGSEVSNEEFELYFLKSNRILSKNIIINKYNGIKLKHYKDSDGKTIIYYEQNHLRGTGVGWYNLCFYKYFDTKLIPILNELERSYGYSLANDRNNRRLNFESYILRTNPLTIKMVFSQTFTDIHYNEQKIIKGSAIVNYKWNKESKMLEGNYSNSGISKNQILTYHIDESIQEEFLFINSYYRILKMNINTDNKFKRTALLLYLNKVKNDHESN